MNNNLLTLGISRGEHDKKNNFGAKTCTRFVWCHKMFTPKFGKKTGLATYQTLWWMVWWDGSTNSNNLDGMDVGFKIRVAILDPVNVRSVRNSQSKSMIKINQENNLC